ncbi:MAG: IS66 family transposase [Thermoleophilaceae bacterium]
MERAEAEAIYDAGREACVEFMVELTARYERQIARLEARIERLEQQVRQSSRNSSKPPSSDPPKTRQERRAEARAKAKELERADRERRRAGGQPGHRGSGRGRAPEDQVDEIVEHYPHSCRGCGHRFTDAERQPSGRPGRHQVAELPPIAVIVSEHRTHRLRCPECRKRTAAELPAKLGGSAFGPRLRAAVVTMSARNRISRRDMSELAGELFGVGLSVGAVDAICQRASAALEGPHERLVASVLGSPALNVDETGWRTAGEGRALWTATTPEAAIFRVASDRHRDRLAELIGDYEGIVCSDRWWAYDHLDPDCRQACWEHLKRDFTRHSEGLAEQRAFGEAGLLLTKRLFAAWHAFEGHQGRARLKAEMEPIQTELRALTERAARKSKRTRLHGRFARNLLKIWPALWTFVTVEGVEPTNNAAERSLRGPVIHRKLSHGTRSEDGERLIERALSASVTCRLQRRSLFAYLTELLTARARGQPPPALV